MSSLALRRAKARYLEPARLPYTGRGRTGHRAGNVYVWAAGIGLVLFVFALWGVLGMFGR